MSLEPLKGSGSKILEVSLAVVLTTRRQTTLFQTVDLLDCFELLDNVALFLNFIVFSNFTLFFGFEFDGCELATSN